MINKLISEAKEYSSQEKIKKIPPLHFMILIPTNILFIAGFSLIKKWGSEKIFDYDLFSYWSLLMIPYIIFAIFCIFEMFFITIPAKRKFIK